MLKCGCSETFLTEVSLPFAITTALSVGCPCCGAPTGRACGKDGHSSRGPWGEVCPSRIAHLVRRSSPGRLPIGTGR
jgi:hypothetical protein